MKTIKKYLQIGIVLMIALTISGCHQEQMKLKKQNYSIEYGQSISSEVSTYLDNSQEFMEDVKISGIPSNEKQKEYPAIGNYELKLSRQNESLGVKVSVVDTVAPVFTDKTEEVTVENGKEIDSKLFKATDLSQ